MIDIHTHLYFPDYDADRKETIERAFSAGIRHMISVSTSPEDHGKALEVSTMDERIFAAVGLHPHWFDEQYRKNDSGYSVRDRGEYTNAPLTEIRDRFSEQLDEIRTLVSSNPKIVAIGECGLDYFSHTGEILTDERKAWQKEGFVAQIRLAQEINLPMIIHCRDAYEDLLEIIGQYGGETIFVIHCYMGDTEVTRKFLTLPNVYFSFTGNITYPVKKALEETENDIRETVKLVPLERMFMETDCPFLAPVPHRGKRNEPSFVVKVAKKIAEIKGCSIASVSESVEENRKTVFGMV